MLRGFKEFITRGNIVDLAVGVVIGAEQSAEARLLTEIRDRLPSQRP